MSFKIGDRVIIDKKHELFFHYVYSGMSGVVIRETKNSGFYRIKLSEEDAKRLKPHYTHTPILDGRFLELTKVLDTE